MDRPIICFEPPGGGWVRTEALLRAAGKIDPRVVGQDIKRPSGFLSRIGAGNLQAKGVGVSESCCRAVLAILEQEPLRTILVAVESGPE
jgi:hypothetical protein